MRSILADQPFSDVVRKHTVNRRFCRSQLPCQTCPPSTSFINFVNGSNSALSSSSFFSSSSPKWNPSFVVDFSFFLSNFYLKTLLAQIFQERQRRHDGDTLAGDVINVVLPFLHEMTCSCSPDFEVVNLDNSATLVLLVEYSWIPSLLEDFLADILLLGHFNKYVDVLLHKVLLDHKQDLVLL